MPKSLIVGCTPIQKQLIGVVDVAFSYYLSEDANVPFKVLLTEPPE
jgi:uncharacterized membrane-anchored protein